MNDTRSTTAARVRHEVHVSDGSINVFLDDHLIAVIVVHDLGDGSDDYFTNPEGTHALTEGEFLVATFHNEGEWLPVHRGRIADTYNL